MLKYSNQLIRWSIKPFKMKNKRLPILLVSATAILLVPFIAMQFSNDVNWTMLDFGVAAILLFGTVFIIEAIIHYVQKSTTRTALILVSVLTLILIWLELAVGIFGSPFAGS